MEDEYEDYETDDEEEKETLVLGIGADGKATIRKPEDYVEMLESEAMLMKDFLEENKTLFNEFIKKRESKDKDKDGEN
jgi:hypothetical protein